MLLVASFVDSALASTEDPAWQTPGFAHLAAVLDNRAGTPTTAEWATPDGTMQLTTTGAVYWQAGSGTLAWTDGSQRLGLRPGSDTVVAWSGAVLDAPAPEPVYVAASVHSVWDDIKDCETPGRGWDANTGNGYYGGIQFDLGSWARAWELAYGPHAGPAGRPDLHTRAVQIELGQVWQRAVGWAHGWPACSRRLGLR